MARTNSGKAQGDGTPALRAAVRAGVPHQVHTYEHDPAAASYGLEAAERLGVDAARVFKTLVCDIDGAKLAIAVVPVAATLDLKAMARAAGGKRAAMAATADAERATGYVVGGISPVGQRRRLPTVVDRSAQGLETMFVSGGRRGLELELAPADLLSLTSGTLAPIAREMQT
jgi:Cys-tRNA(Pro)/Cys-tRNA(Cys) deacylase